MVRKGAPRQYKHSAENIFEIGQRLTLAHRGQSSNN